MHYISVLYSNKVCVHMGSCVYVVPRSEYEPNTGSNTTQYIVQLLCESINKACVVLYSSQSTAIIRETS